MMMEKNEIVIVNRDERLKHGMKDAVFSRVCNKYTCELIPLNVETHSVDKTRLLITGLAITHKPRPGIYIPKETFEKYGNTLVGRPLADGHGQFPWADIKVDETLGVVVEEWYDDEYEAQMFKAEVWDDNAIQVLKRGIYNKFSVAYYYDYEYGKIINEYDEEEDVIIITEMDYDHIAFLNNPQVPESEVKDIEELSCKEPEYMDAMMFSGKDSEYLAKTYRHNSTTKEEEPEWGGVDKTRLPWNSFANWNSLERKKKSTWKYPHHWINHLSKMYLHRGGLVYALAAAKGEKSGKKAVPEVFKHMKKHLKSLNMSSEELKEELDILGLEEKAIEEIIADLYQDIRGIEMPKDEDETPAKEEVEEPEVKEQELQEEKPVEEKPVKEETDGDDDSEQEEETPEEEEAEEPSEEPAEEKPVEEPAKAEAEQNSANESSAIEKVSQMGVELNKKDEEIADLMKTISDFEAEKLESEIEERISELLKDGKITPAKKDETIALYKSMQKEQWDNFEKIIEKNSAVPVGEEKGKMEEESEKDSKKTEKKKFFN